MPTTDVKSRQIIAVDSIPIGLTAVTTATFTLTAGSQGTVNVLNTPDDKTLALWNFAYSNYIDVNNTAHLYTDGSAWGIADDALNVRIFPWLDWADSNDATNTRMYKIRYDLTNCVSDHTFYFYCKAYTQAGVTGAQS